MYVSVIIPVYNDHPRLKAAIESLLIQDYPKNSYEIIIADNGSTDNTLSVALNFKERYPGLVEVVIENSVQSSYAARNKGLNKAKGEVIAFMDSDCIAHSDWIFEGVKKLNGTANCGIIGGRVELFFQTLGSPNVFELYDKYNFFLQKKYIKETLFSVTANLFTYRHIFETVGNFNSNLISGGDREWGNRVASMGYFLAYSKKAVIYHPARYLLKQHLKKRKRVTQGLFDLYYSQYSKLSRVRLILLKDSLPPLKRILKILTENWIKGAKKKITIALLILFFKYLTLYWKLKQAFK